MKSAFIALTVCLLAAVPALSQERPRYSFDNFDTSRGVEVFRKQAFVPIGARNKAAASAKMASNKKFLQPTAQVRPVRQPVTSKMSVSEGLADREMARTVSFNGSFKTPAGSSANLKGFTTGDAVVDSYIVDSSRRYGIDPLLIYSQMHQESTFKARAMSYKGASGLMQLMPATARRLGVTNIFDPKQNIEGGVKYMRMLLDMFGGDVNLALAGYNAGEGAVTKYGNQIPPYNETQEYVRRISARYASISDGTFARSYKRVNNAQAAKLEKRDARPLAVYEPNALAIRLPDGRMRLVNQ
jgi:soluble lytic murein transglycosylase-like protein